MIVEFRCNLPMCLANICLVANHIPHSCNSLSVPTIYAPPLLSSHHNRPSAPGSPGYQRPCLCLLPMFLGKGKKKSNIWNATQSTIPQVWALISSKKTFVPLSLTLHNLQRPLCTIVRLWHGLDKRESTRRPRGGEYRKPREPAPGHQRIIKLSIDIQNSI